ncbi:transposase, partial [Geitlerinema splendidum]|nr:transposase [Geitlerinema splendidum]
MAAKKGYNTEAIIRKLRQAEVMLHEGKPIAEVCRSLSVSDSTYYKWRKEYGGMQVSQAKRLKELEQENNRLKKAVANLTVD